MPARMLNEFVYCPRLFYYEWVEGLFAHNTETVEGSLRHAKLDAREDALAPAEDDDERPRVARSVQLASDRHGLIAKIDLVEAQGTRAVPVDYKRGAPREEDDGPVAWPSDRVQVCVQALVLRDNGYDCDEAVLYYSRTRQRVRVRIDEEIVRDTLDYLERARRAAASRQIPPPLVDSPKCPRCSLVGICLPDETRAIARTLDLPESSPAQGELFPRRGEEPSVDVEPGRVAAAPENIRRLVPARDDLRPLYVTGHGLMIGRSSNVLRIKERRKVIQEVRIGELSQVSVFGNNMLTAGALQGLCAAEIPVAHYSIGGWFYGLTGGLGLKNVFLRRDQFRRAEEPAFCLRFARALVATKLRNQRTLLKRNHIEPPRAALDDLRRLSDRALRAGSLPELLGIEGNGARAYFEPFAGMLKADSGASPLRFDFTGRNRRPPRDPVNAMLSFAYALLVKDLTLTCLGVGFDPFLGFFHQLRFGRPALALDLMEGFRPLVADSAVLTAINTRMVQPDAFLSAGNAVTLNPRGRKALIRAYEQRMDTLVTHPLFGYRVNYRRVLEIQARLLARFVTGELHEYTGFETR